MQSSVLPAGRREYNRRPCTKAVEYGIGAAWERSGKGYYMWGIMGIAVITGIAALLFGLKYRMLKDCVRQAGQDMAEIMENPQENRILRASNPSGAAERLLTQINRYIQYHQQERVAWQRHERQLQEQIENISHDLRTPLTAMLGYLELVDDSRLSEDDREALAVVERRSRYLQGLISDFYDLSRLERQNVRLEQKPVDIVRLIRENVLAHSLEFEERQLSVELELPETAVTVLGDWEALERITHNLLQNALRYAHSYLRICVRSEETAQTADAADGLERRICLDFRNDTDTLTQADIPFLFDRFYTANHARPGGSTGLGLTVSRLLAEAMGGNVSAQLIPQTEGTLQAESASPEELRLTFILCSYSG